jgi:predicted O-methyltransferase YrrM
MNPRAEAIHQRFAAQVGSEHIASAAALDGIMVWLRRRNPKTILEIGPGIGTTTEAIRHAATPERHVAVEDDGWCLDRLRVNVDLTDVEVVASLADVTGAFDFVLVDGPADMEGTLDDLRRSFKSNLSPGATVIFENMRAPQRRVLRESVPGPLAHAHFRPRDGSKGYHVYRLTPTWWERLWLGGVMRGFNRTMVKRPPSTR